MKLEQLHGLTVLDAVDFLQLREKKDSDLSNVI